MFFKKPMFFKKRFGGLRGTLRVWVLVKGCCFELPQ